MTAALQPGGCGLDREPGRIAALRRHAPGFLVALLAAGFCLALLHHLNPRFFFVDDYTAEFYPKLRDIGRMLLEGRMPWQSDRILLAGNYVLEFHAAIFNPVKLAFAVVSHRFDDAVSFSFLYFSFFILLIAALGYGLGAVMALPPWGRVLTSLLCALQPYTIYWQIGGWADPLAAYAWLVAAVATLIHYLRRPGPGAALLIFVATYFTVSAGWPPTIVALGVFAAALCVGLVVNAQARLAGSLAAVFGGAVLFSAPALVSFLLTFAAVADRDNVTVNLSNFSVVTLEGLLQFSNVAYREFLNTWGGYRLQPQPHFYLAWFVMPVLFFLSDLPGKGKTRALIMAALFTAGVFALLALGPERIAVFRFPSRNLQFYLFFLAVAAMAIMNRASFAFSRKRLHILLLAIAVLSLGAAQTAPALAAYVAAAWLAWTVASLILVVLWRPDSFGQPGAVLRGPAGAYLATTSFLAVAVLFFSYPKPRGNDWLIPADAPLFGNLGQQANVLFLGGYVRPEEYAEFRPATTGAITGMAQFNGYTPIGHRGLRPNGLAFVDQGNVSGDVRRDMIAGLLAVEGQTGRQMIELLKVDRIIAFKEYLQDWRDAPGGLNRDDWGEAEERARTVVFSRKPYGLPGSISYATPNLHVEKLEPCPGWSLRECYRVDNRSGAEGRLVFARFWYPGNRIVLRDGERPAESLDGLLTAATVPAGYAGDLVFTYRPPGLRLALAMSALALVGWGIAVFRRRPGTWRWRTRSGK